jgi:hypothetical protein
MHRDAIENISAQAADPAIIESLALKIVPAELQQKKFRDQARRK